MNGSSHTVFLTFFPNDRRLCRTLGLATLFACCDPTLRELLTEFHVTRISAGLQGINYETNCVERTPLHIYQVNGNLCVDETQQQGPAGGGGPAGGAPTIAGTTHEAVLQSILLNQQRT